MKKNVISEIVEHQLCIGCGISAGVCPSRILKMDWKDNGETSPKLLGSCPNVCDICLNLNWTCFITSF